jgi:hypothetical protein
MASINNVITTTYRAQGAQALVQASRQAASGVATLFNNVGTATSMSERLNNQWRAIGTTIRYAIAGQAIFGLTRMVGQLKNVQSQLAEMSALTTAGTGGSSFSADQITQLGKNLQSTAIDTITPLSQVNDAAINFLSTVQNVKPGTSLSDMLTQIGRAATIAQTPILDLTQAVTTQQVAFGRPVNRTTIGQATRMWQELILQAPGGVSASSTIAQQMPSVASMFQLGRGKEVTPAQGQAQMYGLTLGVLRTGMPAATAMRGLTYLLQSIAQPTGKARGALAGIGITPQFVEQHGINAALMKLLRSITRVSPTKAKALGALDDTTMDALDASGGTLPGIPASEMGKLRTMIPRIHGIRAAIILASQLFQQGNVQSIDQDIQMMLNVQDENSKQTKALADAWKRYRSRAKLADAANQVNTLMLQLAQVAEPALNLIAGHVIPTVALAAHRHRRTTTGIVLGTAALAAAYGGRRFLTGGVAGAIGAAQAARSLSGVAPDGSLENPYYVRVIGGTITNPGGLLRPKGGPGGPVAEAEKAGEEASKLGRFGRLGRFLRVGVPMAAARVAWPAAVALGANEVIRATTGTDVIGTAIKTHLGFRPDAQQKAAHLAELKEANRFWGRQFNGQITSIGYPNDQKLPNKAEIDLTITVKHPDGTTTKEKVHISPNAWKNGAAPSFAGKPAGRR